MGIENWGLEHRRRKRTRGTKQDDLVYFFHLVHFVRLVHFVHSVHPVHPASTARMGVNRGHHMPFVFSLEEVLDYRKRIEETRQREMHEARRRVDYVQDLLREARERRAEYRDELNRVVGEGKPFALHEVYINYIRGLDGLIVRSEKHLEELRRELEKRRRFLEYAVRQRRILDELKKEEWKQYRLTESRLESRQYDEIAVRNFVTAQQEKNAHAGEE